MTPEELQSKKEELIKEIAKEEFHPALTPQKDELLKVLNETLEFNANQTGQNPGSPKYFDKEKELSDSASTPYMKYKPGEIPSTGLNILFVSDFEIAGNQARMMSLINHHTIHKARNIIIKRDYLNYGEDIVYSKDNHDEVKELLYEADFIHFVRCIPDIEGINWEKRPHLNRYNCLIDYFGGYLKNNKQQVVTLHRRTGIWGLNKYDWGMYAGAESLPYHIPIMFDAESVNGIPREGKIPDGPIIIGHAPTNIQSKHTVDLLPIIERVNQQIDREIKVDLIMGVSNEEALERKAQCDVFIDLIRPAVADNHYSGCPGLNSLESLAMGIPTFCSLDDWYLSMYPDCPVISCTLENFEGHLLNFINGDFVNYQVTPPLNPWLDQFHPHKVLKQYLHIYRLIMKGAQFVNADDEFVRVT